MSNKYEPPSLEEFQIYNDYVRRMNQRNQLIIEQVQKERCQAQVDLHGYQTQKEDRLSEQMLAGGSFLKNPPEQPLT